MRTLPTWHLPRRGARLRPRAVIAICLIVSAAAVAAAIPFRWEGSRSAQDAYIPLRPLSVEEAAVLLTCPDGPLAAILELEERTVLLATTSYVNHVELIEEALARRAPAESGFLGYLRQGYAGAWLSDDAGGSPAVIVIAPSRGLLR